MNCVALGHDRRHRRAGAGAHHGRRPPHRAGLDTGSWRERPQRVGWTTLLVLLLLTAILAYTYVRRLLRPLDDIRAGAQRFGRASSSEPIPVRRRDELGQLADDVNAMAASIHQMLEAKRGLLLAISHELRSPLTRARLQHRAAARGRRRQASTARRFCATCRRWRT
jgi:signal transduction histidine kinase